jgi:hypothetical protein
MRTGMALQPYRRSRRRQTTWRSSLSRPCSITMGSAILLLVTAYHSIPLADAAQQPHQPSILRNGDGGDSIYGYALDDSHGRRNRLHLHRKKQRRVMLSSEDGGENTSKQRDKVEEQEPEQSAVRKGTSVSLHHHNVNGPRKKKKKVADKEIDAVRTDDMDRQTNAKDDANKVEVLSKEEEKENVLIEKEPWDQDTKHDKTTPQSFGDAKGEVEQIGGMTKKDTDVLKEKKVLQPHAKSDKEEQNAVARTNGWKDKDKDEESWNKPDEGDEGEDWSGCVCYKWESSNPESGSKAGKSKGSKKKGSKTKGSKEKGSKGSAYHKKCIKWSCDKDIV